MPWTERASWEDLKILVRPSRGFIGMNFNDTVGLDAERRCRGGE